MCDSAVLEHNLHVWVTSTGVGDVFCPTVAMICLLVVVVVDVVV